MKMIMKLSAVAVLAVLATGCASKDEVARADAKQALTVANEAKAMSMNTQEQLDRMFKVSKKK